VLTLSTPLFDVPEDEAAPKFTERDMLNALHDRYSQRCLLLHGHEVKVSRSDWLHELADPSKAEAIKRYCDRWWLVVPDPKIVRDDLPAGWGLLAFDANGKLRVVRRAPALNPEPIPATFRGALMRAVAKTARRLA